MSGTGSTHEEGDGSLVAVSGLGTTGVHIVRHLVELAGNRDHPLRLRVSDLDDRAVDRAVRVVDDRIPVELGPGPEAAARTGTTSGRRPAIAPASVAILATPCGTHRVAARRLLNAGTGVVSISDSPEDVDQLLDLDDLARSRGLPLVVGAGMAPGLSCLLARFAGDQLDAVDAVNIAKAGTAGPACARQHHQALKQSGRDWVGDGWELRTGGSGRDLAWFPEPIGARDCYRGALPSPILLHRTYPAAGRVSSRVAATRRDRLTSRLPMLRKPHQDGGPGAVRAEVRGRRDGRVETIVHAVAAFPSSAAAAVAAVVACRVIDGRAPIGASGLSEWPDPGVMLSEIQRRGVPISVFSGALG